MPAKIWKLKARWAFKQIRKNMKGSNGRGEGLYNRKFSIRKDSGD